MFNWLERLIGIRHRAELLCDSEVIPLDKDEYILGRAKDEEESKFVTGLKKMVALFGRRIVFNGFFKTISKNQGRFRWNGETYEYTNLSSTSKPLIVKRRNKIYTSSKPVPLDRGDKIVFDDFTFEFVK